MVVDNTTSLISGLSHTHTYLCLYAGPHTWYTNTAASSDYNKTKTRSLIMATLIMATLIMATI